MTDDFISDWAATGLTLVVVPSGRQLRLRLPEPRDLIVRGVLPSELIEAVLANPDADWSKLGEGDQALAVQMVESMNLLAADSIRQGRRTDADEWEAITVPLATYMKLPDEDREFIEAKILGNLPEASATTPEGERDAREEAAATVDGYREFRDEHGRPARRKSGGKVRPASLDDDRPAAADGSAGDRPRADRAPRGS